MAELTSFGFRPGRSVLHRLDVRFKLLLLILISLSTLSVSFLKLGILTLPVVAVLINTRLSLKSSLKELRFFLVLLLMIFFIRTIITPGLPVVDVGIFAITRQGLSSGVLICWRLMLIVILGLLFVCTTKSSEIKTAVEWFLKPFPFVPAKRVATMMSLIMRFVPVILNQAKETADAQRARCVENRKNPVYRLIKLGIPLIRRTFETADQLAVAMEARCYSEHRTSPELSANRMDWIYFLVSLLFCFILIGL
jgi:biotin transport system permease protein